MPLSDFILSGIPYRLNWLAGKDKFSFVSAVSQSFAVGHLLYRSIANKFWCSPSKFLLSIFPVNSICSSCPGSVSTVFWSACTSPSSGASSSSSFFRWFLLVGDSRLSVRSVCKICVDFCNFFPTSLVWPWRCEYGPLWLWIISSLHGSRSSKHFSPFHYASGLRVFISSTYNFHYLAGGSQVI